MTGRFLGIALLFAAGTASFLTGADRDLFPFDDSHITLAAARNLGDSGVLAVDPAKPWRGVTSPLHVTLVAYVGTLLGVDVAARAVGVAAHVALVMLAAWLAGLASAAPGSHPQIISRATAWAALFAAVSGYLTLHSLSGMDTTLFTALVMGAFVAHAHVTSGETRPMPRVFRGLLVAAAIATRPEGFVLAIALWGDEIFGTRRNERQRSLRPVLMELALVAAAVFPIAWAYHTRTESWWCDTGAVKAAFFRLNSDDRALRSIGAFLDGVLRFAFRHSPYVFLAALAWRCSPAMRPAMRAPIAFAVLFSIGAAAFPAGLQMYWLRYQMPILALMIPFAAAGLALWCENADSRRRSRAIAAVVVFLLLDLLAARRNFIGDLRQMRVSVLATANWIRQNTKPDDLVAAHDIGAIIDIAKRPVLDLVGLIDPEAADANRADVTKRALWDVVRKRRPAWLVMFDAASTTFFDLDDAMENGTLERVWQSEAGPIPEKRYTVYRCRWDDMPPPS